MADSVHSNTLTCFSTLISPIVFPCIKARIEIRPAVVCPQDIAIDMNVGEKSDYLIKNRNRRRNGLASALIQYF